MNKQDALDYHSNGKPGKVEIRATKPLSTQRDLSLAYSPGVAVPVLEIAKDPEKAYKYTAKGNLVAVLSNGSAILGLGNRGALASKPVMEGKGVLFKAFADIDVRHQLPKISVPTLVIHSRGDQRINWQVGRDIAAEIPDAELVTLDSDNHLLLEGEPAAEQFLSAVKSFLLD